MPATPRIQYYANDPKIDGVPQTYSGFAVNEYLDPVVDARDCRTPEDLATYLKKPFSDWPDALVINHQENTDDKNQRPLTPDEERRLRIACGFSE